jgi:hypothetical protein
MISKTRIQSRELLDHPVGDLRFEMPGKPLDNEPLSGIA